MRATHLLNYCFLRQLPGSWSNMISSHLLTVFLFIHFLSIFIYFFQCLFSSPVFAKSLMINHILFVLTILRQIIHDQLGLIYQSKRVSVHKLPRADLMCFSSLWSSGQSWSIDCSISVILSSTSPNVNRKQCLQYRNLNLRWQISICQPSHASTWKNNRRWHWKLCFMAPIQTLKTTIKQFMTT